MAVASLSLDRSSESMSSFSAASSSIVDIEDKDSGNEKDFSISQDAIQYPTTSSLGAELITIDESLVKVERRKSASQGSMFVNHYFSVQSKFKH